MTPFLGPWEPSGDIFSLLAEGFLGRPSTPHSYWFCLSMRRCALAREYMRGPVGSHSQGFAGPLRPLPKSLQCSRWSGWASPQELGSPSTAPSGSKCPMVLWGISPAAQIQPNHPEWSWESSRTVVFHGRSITPKGSVRFRGDVL